jgi:Ni,Fe-hydrogenase maturation factor
VGAELGGHFILTTDNVVFVDAATLGTAHGSYSTMQLTTILPIVLAGLAAARPAALQSQTITDLLACDAVAVGAELGGHFILTTDNVVFVDAATLGTAHGEVGYAPDNVVGDCLGLEGGGYNSLSPPYYSIQHIIVY